MVRAHAQDAHRLQDSQFLTDQRANDVERGALQGQYGVKKNGNKKKLRKIGRALTKTKSNFDCAG